MSSRRARERPRGSPRRGATSTRRRRPRSRAAADRDAPRRPRRARRCASSASLHSPSQNAARRRRERTRPRDACACRHSAGAMSSVALTGLLPQRRADARGARGTGRPIRATPHGRRRGCRLPVEQGDVLRHDRPDVVGDEIERSEPGEHLEREAAPAPAAQRVAERRRVEAERGADRERIVREREVRGVQRVVQQLRAQTRSERAHVQDRIAVRLEHRPGARHGRVGTADVDGESTLGGDRAAAAHRRVDHVDAARRGRVGDLGTLVGTDRGVQREHAARPPYRRGHRADRA